MLNSLLPENYQDTNNLALEECIKQVLNVDLKKIMIFPIENVSEELLPYLAKENHIMGFEGWNLVQNLKEKQDLIINSLIMHTKKGTKNSIKEALKKINIECEIQEFWEYSGRPGHYQIPFLQIFERSFTEELENAVWEMTRHYAPKSRILDNIKFYLCTLGKIFVSANAKYVEKTTITTNEAII
ncbi:MAG: phage tail protein I [Candidatus Gastranaerophilaceae bacterium]